MEKPKSQNSIPATKVQRASKFMKTGVKVGSNIVKHYAKKMVDKNRSVTDLHEDNARDIYDALSELKGSALKVAQMMSMDKNVLPEEYSDKFQMAQYSAPPLSFPLVNKTFQSAFGSSPQELFDSFTKEAVNAASIGQVHQATKSGKKLAVKIQYPGVAESVKSDLKMVKPFAVSLLRLNEHDVQHYMEEVQSMLLDETDYLLELERSIKLSQACSHIKHLKFPKYYPEYSNKKILTMDWVDGEHIDKFIQKNPPQEVRDRIGQALWDFYDYQIHELKELHADPHPGNFILDDDGTLGIIDFGCVKKLPHSFYDKFFSLVEFHAASNWEGMRERFYELNFIYEEDTPEEKVELEKVLNTMIGLLGRPFYDGSFDFGDDSYFQEIYEFGEKFSKMDLFRKSKRPRGMRDGLYLNRTYFGLYAILNQLKARVITRSQKDESS